MSSLPNKVPQLRPPNPYDFGSVCQYLDELLSLPDIYQEYRQVIVMSESRENDKIENSEGAKKQKLQLSTLEEDPFEMAMLRAFWGISSALIEFKKKPQKEQDLKREFLHQENQGSVKNALTTAGFPEVFGKSILGLKLPQFQGYNLSKALFKGHGVFDRAFNFAFKDSELTRKNTSELIENIKRFETHEDVRLYLNTLLYKVEVTSTEKSFNSMKRIVREALAEHLTACKAKRDTLDQNPKSEVAESDEAFALQLIKQKVDVIAEYQDLYFANDDFVYVDKQVAHLKKGAKIEATEKTSKPILSDEFSASVGERPLIQLITGLKKAYNLEELYLIKQHLLIELFKDDPEKSDAAMAKFVAKKKLILEAIKRTRTDMMVEDVFNSTHEQKKQIIELMEQEMLRNSNTQLKGENLLSAEKRAGGLISTAQRALKRKAERANEAVEEEKQKVSEEQNLGEKTKKLIVQVFGYASGKTGHASFSKALEESINPLLKDVLATMAGMEKGETKDKQKVQLKAILQGLSKKIDPLPLDSSNKRALQMWVKGILGRIDYS
jgi:hypothetical protein